MADVKQKLKEMSQRYIHVLQQVGSFVLVNIYFINHQRTFKYGID